MGVLETASYNSVWNGYDYCDAGRVKDIKKVSDGIFDATVSGTYDYFVHLEIEHPRKSTCTCPHAAGRRVTCKHIVALFFAVNDAERNEYKRRIEAEEAEEERIEEEREKLLDERKKEILAKVKAMSESEVRKELISMMMDDAIDEIYADDDDDYYWR